MSRSLSIVLICAATVIVCLWMAFTSRQQESRLLPRDNAAGVLPQDQPNSASAQKADAGEETTPSGSTAVGTSHGKASVGLGPQSASQSAKDKSEAPAAKSDRDVGYLLEMARRNNRLAELCAELAVSGSRSNVIALLQTIESAKGAERDELARTLQALHSSEAAREIQEFMMRNSGDSVVAAQARDALARVATEPDIRHMADSIPSDPEQGLQRSYLLGTLARVRNPDSVATLAELCMAAQNPALYTSTAIALGNIGTPEAVAALVNILNQRTINSMNDPVSQALISVANKDSWLLLQNQYQTATNQIVHYATAQAMAAIAAQPVGQTNNPPQQ